MYRYLYYQICYHMCFQKCYKMIQVIKTKTNSANIASGKLLVLISSINWWWNQKLTSLFPPVLAGQRGSNQQNPLALHIWLTIGKSIRQRSAHALHLIGCYPRLPGWVSIEKKGLKTYCWWKKSQTNNHLGWCIQTGFQPTFSSTWWVYPYRTSGCHQQIQASPTDRYNSTKHKIAALPWLTRFFWGREDM